MHDKYSIIHNLVVINPTKLGKKQLRLFKKHLNSYPANLPPLIYIDGADKNLVNFNNNQDYVIDNKSLMSNIKLSLGIDKYQFSYQDNCKYFFKT